MSTQGSAANYVDISSQIYGLILDTVTSAARRRFAYWKSVWEIASRPYTSMAMESPIRESFDRANRLANLTVGELRSRGQRSAEFSEKLLAQVEQLQDATFETYRDLLKASVSAVNQVKEATTAGSGNGVKPREADALLTAYAGTNLDRAVALAMQDKADIRYTNGTSLATTGAGATQAQIDAAAGRNRTDEDVEIQLRAERLVIDKQRVQHAEARIHTEIVTEMKSIDVPVSHEELVIERHAITGDRDVDSEPIADETIRIPLTAETVNITKETVVLEEVEIGKRRVEDVEHISDTVRHEELRIDDAATDQVAHG